MHARSWASPPVRAGLRLQSRCTRKITSTAAFFVVVVVLTALMQCSRPRRHSPREVVDLSAATGTSSSAATPDQLSADLTSFLHAVSPCHRPRTDGSGASAPGHASCGGAMLCEQQPRYHSERRRGLRRSCPAPQNLLAVLVACLLSTAAHACSDHSAQHSSQQLDHSLTGRRSLQSTDKLKAKLRSKAVARHSVHATAQGHTAQLRKRLQSARDSVAAALAALKAAVARKRNAAATAHPPPPSRKPPPPAHKPATAQLETVAPLAPLGMNTTIHKRACGQPAVSPAEATAVQNRLAPGIISRQTVRSSLCHNRRPESLHLSFCRRSAGMLTTGTEDITCCSVTCR